MSVYLPQNLYTTNRKESCTLPDVSRLLHKIQWKERLEKGRQSKWERFSQDIVASDKLTVQTAQSPHCLLRGFALTQIFYFFHTRDALWYKKTKKNLLVKEKFLISLVNCLFMFSLRKNNDVHSSETSA